MNLVRLGHYFSPSGKTDTIANTQQVSPTEAETVISTVPGGSCRTALVCGHSGYGGHPAPDGLETVNLVVFGHDGDLLGSREGVLVSPPLDDEATFHLSADCPWKR